jgi:short-subunit dehydrogenase
MGNARSARGRKFGGRDELPVATASRPDHCVLDDERPGRRAFVTGASSGIGKAYAEALGAAGWNLTVAARDTTRLEALKSTLGPAHHVEIKVFTVDLTTREGQVRAAAELAGDASIDLLINNAGVSMSGTW